MTRLNILSTKKLQPLIVSAVPAHMELIQEDYIDIRPLQNDDSDRQMQQLIASGVHTIALTSSHGAEAFAAYASKHPASAASCSIYCLSGNTRTALQTAGLANEVRATAGNAHDLANRIMEDGIKELLFFCGNLRRPELPQALSAAGVTVHELVVYETLLTPVAAPTDVQAVLFFSPSAVESFFSLNQLNHDAVCFAIGNTTADSIAGFTNHKIVVSSKPAQEAMLQAVLSYFEHIN